MIKKLIFCLFIINTLNVWADLYLPASQENVKVTFEEKRGFLKAIKEKWQTLSSFIATSFHSQEERRKSLPHSSSDLSDPLLRATDVFLRECT